MSVDDVIKDGQSPAGQSSVRTTTKGILSYDKSRRLKTILNGYVVCEFLIVAVSAFLAADFYRRAILHIQPANVETLGYLAAAIILAAIEVLVLIGMRNLDAVKRQSRHAFLWTSIPTVGLALSLFLTLLFVTKFAVGYSRGAFGFQVVGVAISVLSLRAFFYSWLLSAISSNLVEARRVVLIGDADQCSLFGDRLSAAGIRIVGSFQMPQSLSKQNGVTREAVRHIATSCRRLKTDDVVVLGSALDMTRAFALAKSLSEFPAGVHFVPTDALDVLASSNLSEIGDILTVQVHAPALSTLDMFIKRSFDVACALAGLILLFPLLLAVSLVIRLDSSGPVLFRQTRHGYNNAPIRVLKFRTMYVTENGAKFQQAQQNDSRITALGGLLRQTNIDEFPQLIDVLMGRMSIVGPRPHAVAHNRAFENLIPRYSRRHNLKPGITGWAQVNGHRGETDTLEKMQRRIECDLYYIDNWSIIFDFKIVLLTFFSKKAYMNAY